MDDPEFIVIGSGAGGGPLAAGLAHRGHKVLLLEAGGDLCAGEHGKLMYEVPIFNALCTEFADCAWDFFVNHYDDPIQARKDPKYDEAGGGIFYPRAGTLGGCTAHNAMIIVRPQAIDWDTIARLTGDWSWRADNMNRYFTRIEDCRYLARPGNPVYAAQGLASSVLGLLRRDPNWRDWAHGHGFGGWLATAEARPELILKDPVLTELVLKVVETARRDKIGSLFDSFTGNFDPNDIRNARYSPEGLALTPLSILGGKRIGPREYLLATERQYPGNLEIRLNTLVTRIVFEDKTAVGIEVLEGTGLYQADPRYRSGSATTRRTLRASREIILCGGAFNSPQLLMLSGIGPAAELARHNIPVIADRPGVGANLQDRYEISVVSAYPKSFALLAGASFAPPQPGVSDPVFAQWEKGQGIYASNGALIGLMKRSTPDLPEPDLYIFGLPGTFRGYYRGWSQNIEHYRDQFSWVILKAYTNNQAGRVSLRSADPTERPQISFHSFSEGSDEQGDDIAALLKGFTLVRQLNQHLGIDDAKEILPGPEVKSEPDIRAYIQNQAWGHHASCTNKIGTETDPMAVLDSKFRVRGVRNLRVVDASVFPRIPGYFIVTPTYMISEKAVDVISDEARL